MTFIKRLAFHYSPTDSLPGSWRAERSDKKGLNQPSSASHTLPRAAWRRLSGNKPDKELIIYWERPEEKLFGFQKTFRPSNNRTNNISMFLRKALLKNLKSYYLKSNRKGSVWKDIARNHDFIWNIKIF